MTKKRTMVATSLLLMSVTIPLNGQTQPDAEALRQTLAKIVFANQVTVIDNLSRKSKDAETSVQLQQALTDSQLQFTVADWLSRLDR